MKQTVLKADLRTDSPKKTRASGFIPGVLHGPGTQSRSVQFERSSFIRILAKHGSNAKVWVELGKEKNFGIFKEIQRDPLDKSIIHATIHLVSQDQELKMLVPLVYTGREDLENRILMIQTIKEHVEMSGKAASIPESIVVDISAKELGDSVTVADMQLRSSRISVLSDPRKSRKLPANKPNLQRSLSSRQSPPRNHKLILIELSSFRNLDTPYRSCRQGVSAR